MLSRGGLILFWIIGLVVITWMPPMGDYAMRVFYLLTLFLLLDATSTLAEISIFICRLYMIACTIALFIAARDAQNEVISRLIYPHELSDAMNTPQMDRIRTCLRAMGNDGIALLNLRTEGKKKE